MEGKEIIIKLEGYEIFLLWTEFVTIKFVQPYPNPQTDIYIFILLMAYLRV